MKALVTGGTGFIGSHLADALTRSRVKVRCLIRKTSAPTWLKNLPIKFVSGDCNDKASLEKAVRGVDWVFHLAGVTRAVKEKTYFDVNGLGTKNLIRACLEKNPRLRKFIYISSQAAAGPGQNGSSKKETDTSEPVSLYGRSKRMGEASVHAHAHELPVLILRPCSVYGPRDKDVFTLFKCISLGIKPCLISPDQRLSLCYVQDIIRGILLAVKTETKSGEIFFLSDGHDYGMKEIGDICAHAMGRKALRIHIPKPAILGMACFAEYLSKFTGRPPLLSKDKTKDMIQKNWVCDITKAKTVLGFEPGVPLPVGAGLTFEWYKKEKWL